MKKNHLLKLVILLSFGLANRIFGQQELLTQTLQKSKDSKEYFKVTDNTPGTGMKGTKGFYIQKIDRTSQKEVFKVELEIPDNSSMRYPISNGANFFLKEDNVIAVYDVKEKSSKNCYLRYLNTITGKLGENKLVFSDEIKDKFKFHLVVYKVFYSPDNGKLAILKDNISPDLDINSELKIYDMKTQNLISNKNLGQKYNNVKRVFDVTKLSIDNDGNVSVVFNIINEKTNMTTKSYSAKLPASVNELQDIKELSGNAFANGSSQTSHGRFYKTLKDFIDDKPIKGTRIKNGSYTYSIVKGYDFKLVDDEGNLTKEDAKNLPSDLFTYKRDDYSEPILMRIVDKKPYIVLAAGKFSYYALYIENREQTYTEGWESTDMKNFKEKVLKDYLKQYGLLDEYENTMPKREMKDNVNEWFNKNVNHNIEFINKLNKKMN
ncbi:MAG: hypothetical protein JNM51_08755 [Bacteroidia bacterium]|nr:hypothetical protein [Bacteroidia bacterium]